MTNKLPISIYDIAVTDSSSKEILLEEFWGQLLLIVNTASRCGFTPQFGDPTCEILSIKGFACGEICSKALPKG